MASVNILCSEIINVKGTVVLGQRETTTQIPS